MTKALIIGDLGWNYLYHLGDEAMTEAAAQVLSTMGVEVTLVAGNADAALKRYGYSSVPRPGFKKSMSLDEKESHLEALDRFIARGESATPAFESVWNAVQSTDAVIVGGGGNLNSGGEHHIFDRVALCRMARAAGKPFFVTSQTVGPALGERHAELVTELAESAVCFGLREPTSATLVRRLAPSARVVETVDDATMLDPAPWSTVQDLFRGATPDRYAIGSFTTHTGTTGLSQQEYVAGVARALDEIAAIHGVEVLLIPHMGKFAPARPASDQVLHELVSARSRTGRVRQLPMIDARTALALTQHARFTVSTRYHPVVFGPAVHVPAIGIELSEYSHIRMQGALGNVGLARLGLPVTALRDGKLLDAIGWVESDRSSFHEHVRSATSVRRREQLEWWSRIVGAASTGSWTPPPTRATLPEWQAG